MSDKDVEMLKNALRAVREIGLHATVPECISIGGVFMGASTLLTKHMAIDIVERNVNWLIAENERLRAENEHLKRGLCSDCAVRGGLDIAKLYAGIPYEELCPKLQDVPKEVKDD